MDGSSCMLVLLVLLVGAAGCSPVDHPNVVYTAPAATPYHHKPRLEQQYLRAHRAGWTAVVLAFSPSHLREAIANKGHLGHSTWTTCCEATRNITTGWYRGQEDALRFLQTLAIRGAEDPTIVSGYRALQRRLRKAPVVDWYVADGYDPTKKVKEVAYEGDLRIETTYRDETRTTLLSVARYRGEVLDGDLEEYDGNGELAAITPYRRGLIEGVRRDYSDTGAILSEVQYYQGMKQGASLGYNESGELTGYTE